MEPDTVREIFLQNIFFLFSFRVKATQVSYEFHGVETQYKYLDSKLLVPVVCFAELI